MPESHLHLFKYLRRVCRMGTNNFAKLKQIPAITVCKKKNRILFIASSYHHSRMWFNLANDVGMAIIGNENIGEYCQELQSKMLLLNSIFKDIILNIYSYNCIAKTL